MQRLRVLNWPARVGAFRGATWLHLTVILAAGAALRWPLLTLAPFFTTDSRCCYYHYAANQLLAGQPFDSRLHLPPGYSLFLAAILAVTDGSTAAAMLVQHLLGLAAGLLVYLIGRRLFGPLVGLAAALLTVLDVELALYEHAVMTETLFTVLLLCALAVVLLRLPGSIWLKVAGFGLLAGAATLVRPTGLLLPGLVLLLPGLGPARGAAGAASRNARYRQLWHASRRVRLTLVAIVGAALIVVPVMVWNKRTHGVFALTSSLQRNMLYPIEAAPRRLLQGRGGGDPLLGQVKATISHHPTPAWVGPYGRVLERFHLSYEALDRLLMRVALDFVLADPLAYVGDTMRRLPRLLTASGATAVGLVQWGHQEYIIAGGADKLGVNEYDYAAELEAAHAFDQRTGFLRYGHYAWPLLGLAVLGMVFRPGRALVAGRGAALCGAGVGRNEQPDRSLSPPGHLGDLPPRHGWCGRPVQHATRHVDIPKRSLAWLVAHITSLAESTARPVAGACRAAHYCGRAGGSGCGAQRFRSPPAGGSTAGHTQHHGAAAECAA